MENVQCPLSFQGVFGAFNLQPFPPNSSGTGAAMLASNDSCMAAWSCSWKTKSSKKPRKKNSHHGKLRCFLEVLDHFIRTWIIFQPTIFRGYVSFRGGYDFPWYPMKDPWEYLPIHEWLMFIFLVFATKQIGGNTSHNKILLMVQKSSVHQLRLVVYPIIYRVFYRWCRIFPGTLWQ